MNTGGRKLSMILKTLALLLLVTGGSNAATASEVNFCRMTTNDSIVIKRMIGSKHHKPKLHRNASNEKLVFSAQGRQGRSYQLYLFDMSGELVRQSTIQAMEAAVLKGIQKGNYLFEVFNNDLRIENGSVAIK